jgi:hypothetical protein
VLVSPLLSKDVRQSEVVKAAQSIGIPTGCPLPTWDALSTRGRIHVAPDRVFAWNETHRREAVELHGVDSERVVVTGAPHWDSFFEFRPSHGRDDFCREHGFDPARPIVLYLGSTPDVCTDEPLMVERWLDTVRRAPGRLREANILVRPHPGKRGTKMWSGWSPSRERVSRGGSPVKRDQSLYDELHHSAAVVGLNTTAQIEASILGKPVYTFSAGEDAPGQEGTLHFYHLLEEHGGVVTFAETLDEHVNQLERGISGDYDREAIRRFCEAFVRPHGLDRPVAPILAGEVVALGRSDVRHSVTGALAPVRESTPRLSSRG